MADFAIRKIATTIEATWHDGGPRRDEPLTIGVVAAVVRNPDAGRYVEDILPHLVELKELGQELAAKLLAALGNDSTKIEAYGKGAIVGVLGDIEYGALWHEAGGWSMREVLGGTKAIVPSSKMIGTVGSRLQIPLGSVRAAFVRSHMLVTDIGFHDAPRPDEIVYALAMANGGRVHARAGGLRLEDAVGEDGQR